MLTTPVTGPMRLVAGLRGGFMDRVKNKKGKVIRVCDCCGRTFVFFNRGGPRKYCPQCKKLVNAVPYSHEERKEAVQELLVLFLKGEEDE